MPAACLIDNDRVRVVLLTADIGVDPVSLEVLDGLLM